jgi:3-hydroxyacyl-CoA dehydrogenase
VLGSGYVGLPTAALFAEAGFSVTAVDVKREVVEAVNRGLSPISELGLSELVKANVEAGRLKASLASQIDWRNVNAVIRGDELWLYYSVMDRADGIWKLALSIYSLDGVASNK